MSAQPEALRLADALVYWHGLDSVEYDAAAELRRLHAEVASLRSALAQEQAEPAQEPVAWIYQNAYTEQEYLVWKQGNGGRNWTPLYTAPPRCPNCASLEAQNTELDRNLAEMERAHGIIESEIKGDKA